MIERKWYKLDNIGILYASTAKKNLPNVFRYSAELKDKIDELLLQESLNNTLEIYPNFNVNLKKGLFWYYLQETNKHPNVTIENIPICSNIYNNEDDFLFRISYYKNKINFEVCHILSDGRGSIEFFKVLVSNYIKLKYKIKDFNIITNSSRLEKIEDSFYKYYQKKNYRSNNKLKIYNYKGKKMKNQTLFMECHLATDKVLSLAHKYKTTMTAFLVSILIYSFRDELSISDLNKTIKIEIPVDLRTYFNSKSSKNFFGLAHVFYKFNSKADKLEDIISSVNKQFKEKITIDELSKRTNQMVSFEKNLFCRFVPISLKNIVISKIYQKSSKMSTTCLSNVGKIEFDDQISKYIESINILTSTNRFQFTICSYKNNLSIGISSKYKYNNIIKNFCCFFPSNNIEATINVSEVR